MVSIEELERQLNSGKLSSIYLLYGEEKYLIENDIKKIKKIFGELIKGINYILIDENNIDEIISDIETPAFGYSRKLIIAKDTGLFKKDGKKKNAKTVSTREKLNEYIKNNINIINEMVVVIFTEDDVDKNELFKTIDKIGCTCKFDYQKPIELQKRIKAICQAYKVNIDNFTLQYFIESCGTSMQDLINEIRKLIEYVGTNGTIQKEDIDKLSIKQIDSVIFDLTDNLGKKNIKNAMEVLQNLLYLKEPIQKILVTLYNHFKKLYLVKLALKYNKDVTQALNLKPNQTFLVSKYKNQASYFNEKDLRIILKELADLDYKYKVGLIDINIGLETILCTYCS